MNLTGMWLGHIVGTNRGLVSVQLAQDGESVRGEIVFDDVEFGRSAGQIEGALQDQHFSATARDFVGTSGVPPHLAELDGVVDAQAGRLAGTWKTNIGTQGTFVLSKQPQDATHPARRPPQAPPPWSIDVRNIGIPSFTMPAGDLRELARAFLEAGEKARTLEVDSLRRTYTGARVDVEIARLPLPRIEVTETSGRFTVINDVASFSADQIPQTVKSVEFYSYKQGDRVMPHVVQIGIKNINGSDVAAGGFINVHGVDQTWLAGTFSELRISSLFAGTGGAGCTSPLLGKSFYT